MNNATRKKISDLISQLEGIKGELEEIQSEEQEKFDNLSDGLQASEKGQAIELAASNLENACSELDSIIGYLEDSKE